VNKKKKRKLQLKKERKKMPKNNSRNKPNEIYISRIYDAPVKMVWNAWTDPEQVAQWWGPRGFTLTTEKKDVRTGGVWNYTMHGPDGVNYPNKTKFLEVEKYSRMVYDHGANDEQGPLFRVTVTFAEVNGKTKMEMTMALPTPEAAIETKKFIKKAGGDSTWDRLAEFLAPEDTFVINRSFKVTQEKMFDLWISPDHFQKWLPPTGFSMKFIEAHIQPGGTSFYCMTSDSDANMKMYGKIHYIEMTRPSRLLYTQQFANADGSMARHPMAPTWPESMRTLVTFTAESENETRVTINWTVDGNATAEERKTFHEAKAGMTQGWGGSFEKLEEYIQKN
jgi:uncharacterized protein YndB with AHSA1/START domain